jgi:hypothetical protein
MIVTKHVQFAGVYFGYMLVIRIRLYSFVFHFQNKCESEWLTSFPTCFQPYLQ